MSTSSSIRENEVAFCGDIKSWAGRYAAQAELVSRLSGLGVTGEIAVPKSADDCRHCRKELNDCLRQVNERFAALAASRTGNFEMQEKTATLLLYWHIHGRG